MVISGIYWDNGKENGNYYLGMENQMENKIEHEMETRGLYRDY